MRSLFRRLASFRSGRIWHASRRERQRMAALLQRMNARGQPNLSALTVALADVDALALSVKALGYELARSLAAALPLPARVRSPAP